jgi:hypothetical protein
MFIDSKKEIGNCQITQAEFAADIINMSKTRVDLLKIILIISLQS